MRQVSVASLLILALSLFGATTTRAEEPTVITHLITRDRVITITSDSNGLLYSVSTKDGAVIDANLSEEQLQAKYPEVYDNVRPAIASDESTEGVIPWAGMFE
jgi:hypothetical protein